MANQDPLTYFHHASAFGVSGQMNRPNQQTISTQASVSLPPTGGNCTHGIENYSAPGIVSCSAAHVNVGGSFDSSNDVHATYSCSVIENLNICDVVTADKVVSRLTVYHPAHTELGKRIQPSFSISGSHFENLRILGHQVNVKLASNVFNDSTYNKFCDRGEERPKANKKNKNNPPASGPVPHPNSKWLVGSDINRGKLDQSRELLGHNYDIVESLANRFDRWDPHRQQPAGDHHYRCSPANELNLDGVTGKELGFINFGCIVCVPRFGVIYLAELLVYHNHRNLTMIRVHMCSPGEGNIVGGGTTGGGGDPMPPH